VNIICYTYFDNVYQLIYTGCAYMTTIRLPLSTKSQTCTCSHRFNIWYL